jgi:Domain of Unknown Function with PDB structure (DUF3857)
VLYGWRGGSYTYSVTRVHDRFCVLVLLTSLLVVMGPAFAQDSGQKPAESAEKTAKEKPAPPEKSADKPEPPFQIQLLENHIRFETNGDSRKEVHTIVKINNIWGASQFARLTFDYNRAFQQVEIPLVRISHASGGTSEVLPSAVVDAPNPAVEKFPAYQDVRVKSVRILGLQEGDTVEYRVITTTTKHPLAPDFWLEHTFDRSGQVLNEDYELDLPATRKVEVRISPTTPPSLTETVGSSDTAHTIYKWARSYEPRKVDSSGSTTTSESLPNADVSISTLDGMDLAIRLAELMLPGSKPTFQLKTYEEEYKELNRPPEVSEAVHDKADSLTQDAKTPLARLKAIYGFVSTKVATVDLPLEATGFRARPADSVLKSGYATAEDKYVLFAALANAVHLWVDPALTGFCDKTATPAPSVFKHLVMIAPIKERQNWRQYWLDPAVQVAPFGMISPTPAKCAFFLSRGIMSLNSAGHEWVDIPAGLPFASFQRVRVDATISVVGQLTAKVKYVLRGDNELLLRVAFHQTPKERWKDVAGLLAISDGFRGQVTSVNVSDPMETKDPFVVEYQITQAKFVDWSKKTVRIPALLPQIGLPDLPAGTAGGETAHMIELGTPLDVDTRMTLKLPAGTSVQAPAGSSVARDYATFSSKYSTAANTVTASRRVNFLLREIPEDRAMDYNAFVRAVQSDQAQMITLVGMVAPAEVAKPAQTAPKQ